LSQMIDALVASLQGTVAVHQAKAQTVERAAEGYRVRADGEWIEAGHVIVATEAHNASALVRGVDARLGELLCQVSYSSSMTVAVGFDAKDFAEPPQGHGFLVPKKERRRLMACTWVGAKFPYRVPDGKIVARCFLGGMDDAAVLHESDDAVRAVVLEELREIAGVTAHPTFTRVSRWPLSMAQYTVGHPERLKEIEARTAQLPGLHLAGNAYEGIGIPDCIRMGKRAAEAYRTNAM